MPRVVSSLGKWVVHSRGARLAGGFARQTCDVRQTQRQTLQRLLRLNAGTGFHRDHGLNPALTIDEFRNRVPLTDYAHLASYVDHVRRGRCDALCGRRNRPLMFALTSGTTGETKSIPITSRFLADYRRGWMVWAYHAFEACPQASAGKFFQITSDHQRSAAPCGLPCGNISGLVQAMQNRFVRSKYALPIDVTRVTDPASRRYLTLRLGLTDPDITLVSTANPSTLIQLARQADDQKQTLIKDIADGTLAERCRLPDHLRRTLQPRLSRKNPARARELDRLAQHSTKLLPRDYWPRAAMLAVWTGGSAAAYLPALREWYGDLPIRDHGLSASEGRMTIPIEHETSTGVLDVASHFYEFIPEAHIDRDQPETLLAHELEDGATYYIVLTTASGLYRYNICDVVRCRGFYQTAPLLEFLHKGAHISNLTGEKLTESQVVTAVRTACGQLGCRFEHYTLCPVWGDPPGYQLLVEEPDLPEAAAPRLQSLLEQQLQQSNCEYHDKRDSQRLALVQIRRLPPGTWSRYIARQQSRPGASIEQYKHPCLKPDLEFGQQLLAQCSQPLPEQDEPSPRDLSRIGS